jgi:hypothetical protein
MAYTIEDYAEDNELEDMIIFENPDFRDAFIGHTTEGRAVYDHYLMVRSLMKEDGMTEEEAVEFIDYKTLRALPYMGDKAPIVVYLDFLMMGDSCTQQ